MTRFTGIHHPAFVTGNLDKTVHFWRDLLGMPLVYTLGKPGNRQAFFSVSGNAFIAFFEWPQAERIPYRRHGSPRGGPVVFDHVAIAVDSEETLWEILAALEAADIPVSDPVDHGLLRSIYTYDPNGIPLEFTWSVPDIDIVAAPLFKDDDPPSAVLEGARPRPERWPAPEPVPEDEREIVPGEGREHFAT